MKKLYTLCVMAMLTACGSSTPPVWDGEWKGDPDTAKNSTILIVDFAGKKKNVFIKKKEKRVDKCNFINYEDAQGSAVKMRCDMLDLVSLEIKKDGKMTMTLEDGEEYPGYVWVGDPNK